MPIVGERVTPWLFASVVIALANVIAILRGDPSLGEQSALALGLGATLAAAGLVAARSSQELEERDREERARPTVDELVDPASASNPSYVAGMERWSAAMLELIDHALTQIDATDPLHPELAAAATDTRELRELLVASAAGPLSINDTATLHALCSLWETNQARVEHLGAQADARWHRRWRSRSVVERRLRHGDRAPRALSLPYRA